MRTWRKSRTWRVGRGRQTPHPPPKTVHGLRKGMYTDYQTNPESRWIARHKSPGCKAVPLNVSFRNRAYHPRFCVEPEGLVTRSHGPPWECRLGRSASSVCGTRLTQSVEDDTPTGTVGASLKFARGLHEYQVGCLGASRHSFSRSSGPPWECRHGRSASSVCGTRPILDFLRPKRKLTIRQTLSVYSSLWMNRAVRDRADLAEIAIMAHGHGRTGAGSPVEAAAWAAEGHKDGLPNEPRIEVDRPSQVAGMQSSSVDGTLPEPRVPPTIWCET
jgi:hypothetical protein